MLSVGWHPKFAFSPCLQQQNSFILLPGDPRGSPGKRVQAKTNTRRRVAMAVASSLDLISLDNLSRTCRQIHASLLQYRAPLKSHTLHCEFEDVELDPDDTLRYRARAGNWFYMEELGNSSSNYNGKSGQCARDMVAECRRCARVVCRVSTSLLQMLLLNDTIPRK
jgi:hypothetical protein